MRIRRLSAAVAVVASGTLLFSACTSPVGGEGPTGEADTVSASASGPCKADLGDIETADGEIRVSNEAEFLGYNSNTRKTGSVYQRAVTDRLISGFTYFGTDGTICRDETFGTFRAISKSPLEVEYTLDDNAVWSDGVDVTYADYLLEWAAQALTEDGEITDDGTEVPLFDHGAGLSFGTYVPGGPRADAWDAKTFTYKYGQVNADWQLMVKKALPAHVVAEQIGISTEELVLAIQRLELPVLKKAAEFWNEGWLSPQAGELPDQALVPVNGPYRFKPDGWEAGQYITLEANPEYWGTPAATRELTFRQVDATAQAQALANGDLDVIDPSGPTADMMQQLEQLGDAVHVQTGQTLTWEHLDFNFESGAFAESQELREAFAYCVPRQKIVDELIVPVYSEAVVMSAREALPFQDRYDEIVSASYDERYDEVDLDRAKALVKASGAETPIKVRIGYQTPNKLRADQLAAIKSSCDKAGFEIEDIGSKTFFDVDLINGDYEVAMFAWVGSGQISAGENYYSTPGTQNYGKYSDQVVDRAWRTLSSSTDGTVHIEQTKVIEKRLWDTLYGIPLFAHPGVSASSPGLSNVRETSAQDGIVWNAEQWTRTSP